MNLKLFLLLLATEENKHELLSMQIEKIFHFAPTPFSNMSLSRFYVFLPNPKLNYYILNELTDFEFGDHPIIVVYDLEQTENKIRVAHFEYKNVDRSYKPILDIDKIKKSGFIHRL